MNDELQKRLVESLDKVTQYIESTENFVMEQAPLVVQEILKFGLVKHSFFACIFLVIWIVLLILGIRIIRKADKIEPSDAYQIYDKNSMYGCGYVISIASSALFIVLETFSIYYILYICIAPRLYILEQIGHFLK